MWLVGCRGKLPDVSIGSGKYRHPPPVSSASLWWSLPLEGPGIFQKPQLSEARDGHRDSQGWVLCTCVFRGGLQIIFVKSDPVCEQRNSIQCCTTTHSSTTHGKSDHRKSSGGCNNSSDPHYDTSNTSVRRGIILNREEEVENKDPAVALRGCQDSFGLGVIFCMWALGRFLHSLPCACVIALIKEEETCIFRNHLKLFAAVLYNVETRTEAHRLQRSG